jgi:Arylsulfatase A and related enzymes
MIISALFKERFNYSDCFILWGIVRRFSVIIYCMFHAGLLSAQDDFFERKYNVLFIVADDMRPTLGCYGDERAITPYIDNLARRSIVFKNAYCQQAVCNPSRASVLTGLRPDENGVTDLVTHFRQKIPDVVTLPQAFKNAGYTSIGIGKVFHGSKRTLDSVSWSVPSLVQSFTKQDEYYLPENRKGNAKAASYEFVAEQDDDYPDGKIANAAITALQQFRQSGESFFMAVGFNKPHLPFCAPRKYWNMYEGSDFSKMSHKFKPLGAPDIAFHQWQELRGYSDIPKDGAIPSQKEQELWRGYYACVSYVDTQIGRVLSELERLDMSENTIIVFWGDHGYHLGEQGLWCKSTNYELDTRIPLLISVPDITDKGSHTSAIVEALDIYPTLLELCGLKSHHRLSGKSLTPLLENPNCRWEGVAFSQFCRPYEAITKQHPTHMGYTVRIPGWRYVAWYDLNTGSVVNTELYDLKKGNIELHNLSGDKRYKKVEQKLHSLIDAYYSKR